MAATTQSASVRAPEPGRLAFEHAEKVFFTSDEHYGHVRIIDLCERPFASLDEMHQAMIERHNAVVPTDALTVHVGDLSTESTWRVGLEVVRQLNGRHWITPGNHDPISATKRDCYKLMPVYREVFEVIIEHLRIRINSRSVHVGHFPYRGDHTGHDRFGMSRLRDPGPKGDPLICGHVHGEWKVLDNQINVGVDVRDFTPVPMTTIAQELTDIGFGPKEGGDR